MVPRVLSELDYYGRQKSFLKKMNNFQAKTSIFNDFL